MDRNRKIIVSILALMVLSAVLAVIDISLRMRHTERTRYTLDSPHVGPGVGVVRVSGPIQFSEGTEGLFMGAGAEAVLDRLGQLDSDSRIRAVVVRINSPGGTVAATQEIYQKLMKLRSKNVVLVASMGDVAASGGYYIASACNYIVANPGTITASIGVIAVSPNLKDLFQKLGIRMNVIKSGVYKDILASYRDLSEDERRLIQAIIDSSYNQFLRDVAKGRNVAIDDIRPHADGRVMNGESAVEAKLVDELGGFEAAVDKARKAAKLPEDAPLYDEIRSPIDQFFMSLQGAFAKSMGLERALIRSGSHLVEYRYQP